MFLSAKQLTLSNLAEYQQAVKDGKSDALNEFDIVRFCGDPQVIPELLDFSQINEKSKVIYHSFLNDNVEVTKMVFETLKRQKLSGKITQKEYSNFLHDSWERSDEIGGEKPISPLQFACNRGHTEIVLYLLENADVDPRLGSSHPMRYPIIRPTNISVLKGFLRRQLKHGDVFKEKHEIGDMMLLSLENECPVAFICLNVFDIWYETLQLAGQPISQLSKFCERRILILCAAKLWLNLFQIRHMSSTNRFKRIFDLLPTELQMYLCNAVYSNHPFSQTITTHDLYEAKDLFGE